jgi:hypothetical protein
MFRFRLRDSSNVISQECAYQALESCHCEHLPFGNDTSEFIESLEKK